MSIITVLYQMVQFQQMDPINYVPIWVKELTDVVKDLEKDRDEWRVTASNQVEQIRA
nr:hypothetical protein [Tanacetum cinerariifolium]